MNLIEQAKAEATEKAKGAECQDFSVNESKGAAVLTLRSKTIRTLDDALASCEADLDQWEVERWIANKWDCVAKIDLQEGGETLAATELWQVKVWFCRKKAEALGLQALLDAISAGRDVKIPLRLPKKSKKRRRFAIEVSPMDPHMGMECYLPQSDQKWDADLCEQFYLFCVHDIIRQGKDIIACNDGDLVEIVWPFGNDFLHVDGVFHTTTAGTAQPEAISAHESFCRGYRLAISASDMMLEEAPVKAFQIPGNHDRWSSFMMGHVLDAWHRHNDNFVMDASATTYKGWRFGSNLVMFEHGHSIAQVRMAAVMANEFRSWWADTSYHEVHCGDQHRKGSSRPSAFEEQGVSVEFLPGLVAPNEWHKLKSFNFQKRGAFGFVWDYEGGQINRIQVNIDKYTGKFMDSKRFERWKKAC